MEANVPDCTMFASVGEEGDREGRGQNKQSIVTPYLVLPLCCARRNLVLQYALDRFGRRSRSSTSVRDRTELYDLQSLTSTNLSTTRLSDRELYPQADMYQYNIGAYQLWTNRHTTTSTSSQEHVSNTAIYIRQRLHTVPSKLPV